MTEHTPAPWHISASGQYIRKSNGPNWPAWNICEINQDHGRAEANARLIAAAPDLLNELIVAIAWIEGEGELYAPTKEEILPQLYAALEKARNTS